MYSFSPTVILVTELRTMNLPCLYQRSNLHMNQTFTWVKTWPSKALSRSTSIQWIFSNCFSPLTWWLSLWVSRMSMQLQWNPFDHQCTKDGLMWLLINSIVLWPFLSIWLWCKHHVLENIGPLSLHHGWWARAFMIEKIHPMYVCLESF